ncbi:hypothetical protein O6H91_07G082300 [Diphasiastrum complanatum]|uniref:Uncharacterized protein n=1 Tax=Diphasiastrum complanatum TaxID=34168 RepID=A0ACC2D7B8_DIPCM|nr:hypothetical protein O6H91_07G082300 [Diphasiastrum complanatum]
MSKDDMRIDEETKKAEGESLRISDSRIKLFGRTIPFLTSLEDNNDGESTAHENGHAEVASRNTQQMSSQKLIPNGSEEDGTSSGLADELGSSSGSNTGFENAKRGENVRLGSEPCLFPHAASSQISGYAASAQLKEELETDTLKANASCKPHKPVPCPRCDSLETKFCYFNNYNINQPRHFCKRCQRYWTAGGTLRNVPVGAGRRKSKHQNYYQPHMPLNCLVVRGDSPDAAHQLLSCSHGQLPTPALPSHPTSKTSYPIVPGDNAFFSAVDSSSVASTVTALNEKSNSCVDKASVAQISSTRQQAEQSVLHPLDSCNLSNDHQWKPMDDSQCGSSLSSPSVDAKYACASSVEALEQSDEIGSLNMRAGIPIPWPNGVPFTFFPGAWPSLNVAWHNPAAAISSINAFSNSGNAANPVPIPAHFAAWAGAVAGAWPGFPWTSHPGSPWCHPNWSNAWCISWEARTTAMAAAAKASSAGLIGATALGKHPLERQQHEGTKETCLWVPKSLRIDDQGGAARSSILASLGLCSKPESILASGEMLSAFQPKDVKSANQAVEGHENPAASTRSAAF